ncbi:tetratricopeptide repeat protein [Xanthomonas arboricola]|uniref:tetratricopeptide repeat protein n=1 Tax=Xanthomonas arboricola TaxID=56448 RepID=UPI00141B362B|nr:tetratricopeptide repeat protein [Xanthomonas arboricola]NIK32012.1 tetratricopeptide (TPR) repeat protein [Xanthomonas arboricola]NJB78002.1 tetratricopeptide (TPR) repeat protein [Xanthomonas arboricola]CAG2085847.1 tetratricopeptide repeat protein [Xanthomonas arboricola pv. juglandis]
MPVPIRILCVLLLVAVSTSATAAPKKAPPAPPPGRAGTTSLEPVLAGEFALQAGQLDDAARAYLDAAKAEAGDAGLAERAARIAMLANDDPRAIEALALWRARAPSSMSMRSTEASLALRRNDLRTARRDLLGLLKEPDPRGWRFALIALANGGREPEASADVLEDLVKAGAIPNQIEAWQEFGRLALRMERPALAKRIVDEVVRRFPEEPRVALLHATQLQQEGKNDEALALLKNVEPQAVKDSELRGALAFAYDAMGQTEAAARVLSTGPQDTQTYGLRASMLAKEKDRSALEALYGELKSNATKPDPDRRLLLGKIAEFLKRYDEAVEWYRGVPGGPQLSEARLRAASALYELGRKPEALAEARALQSDASADDDARRDAYVLEAELHQRADDAAGELDAFERGLAAYPDDGALLYARGLAWERRDDVARAEADLRKILVAEPENVAALNALGYTLADRTTRYKEALALIDRARTADPDNPAIVDSYGWVLYRMGRTKEALVQLRRAWALVKDPEIAAHVGEVLWVSGKQDEARRYFDEARRLDPDNRALQRAVEKFGL